ncbi:hypothetical protein D6855_12135 [Butyrivibrio sp. CB08]|uniref:hypothetical protein n=1 Tax=Butyrivibrio sp. CB08 TaxID=2364879 RepID=UPI000EA96E71|nr:hypothetical protein [Butyrivibrio sp. CB08]RKM58898.1 hypothetical protein D6855_12135 [Butyrivibrio sp. CB08]
MEHNVDSVRAQIKAEVVGGLDFSREINDEELFELIDSNMTRLLKNKAMSVSDKKSLRMNVYHSIRKLDVLQSLIDDPSITDV